MPASLHTRVTLLKPRSSEPQHTHIRLRPAHIPIRPQLLLPLIQPSLHLPLRPCLPSNLLPEPPQTLHIMPIIRPALRRHSPTPRDRTPQLPPRHHTPSPRSRKRHQPLRRAHHILPIPDMQEATREHAVHPPHQRIQPPGLLAPGRSEHVTAEEAGGRHLGAVVEQLVAHVREAGFEVEAVELLRGDVSGVD